jgi:hypothetical protein
MPLGSALLAWLAPLPHRSQRRPVMRFELHSARQHHQYPGAHLPRLQALAGRR